MNWKPITMAEAVELTNAGESTVYMLMPMTDYTMVKDLAAADGFVLAEDELDPDLETHVIHAEEDPEEDEQPDEDDEEIAEDPEEEDETEDEPAENEDEPEEEEEEPEPEPDPQPEKSSGKRKAWHEKIVNWYMQGRQPEWIAQELGLNKNTVIYHLHKEGLK